MLSILPHFEAQGATLLEKQQAFRDNLATLATNHRCVRVEGRPYNHYLLLGYNAAPVEGLEASLFHLADSSSPGLFDSASVEQVRPCGCNHRQLPSDEAMRISVLCLVAEPSGCA